MYALFDPRTEEISSFTDWKIFQTHIRASIIRNDIETETTFPHLMEVYRATLPTQAALVEQTYQTFFSSLHCFLDPTASGGHPYVETLHSDPFDYDQSVKALTDVQAHFRDITKMRVGYKASIYLTDRFPDKVYFQLKQHGVLNNEYFKCLHHKLTRVRAINEFLAQNV